MAASIAVQLYYSEGYSGPTLLQRLRARAAREGYSTLSDDTLRRIVAETCGGGDPLMAVLVARDLPTLLTYIPKLAELEAREPVQYAALLGEIRSAFAGREHAAGLRDFFSALAGEKRRIKKLKPDVATVAEEWAKDAEDTFAYDPCAETWRYWNEQYWERVESKGGLLDTQARTRLHEAEIPVNGEGGLNVFGRTARSLLTRDFPTRPPSLAVQNGILTKTRGEQKTMRASFRYKHDPEDGHTSVLPLSYTPYGAQHPHITRFLEETIPDEYGRQLYLAHIGLALLGDTTFRNALVLIGPRSSGKSTLLALARAASGAGEPWSFAGPSLFSRDTEGKRARARWNKERLVSIDELPAESLREEEILKVMLAHSSTEQRDLYKSEQTSGNQWQPKLLLAANERPHYKDTSGAVADRLIFLDCPHTRAKTERYAGLLEAELLPELEAFVATCLAYGLRLLELGYYPESPEMKRIGAEIARAGDPLKTFLEDECVLGEPEAWVPTRVLYARYAEVIHASGNKPLAANKLSMALGDMRLPGLHLRSRRYEGELVRGLQGIRLKRFDEKQAELEEEEHQHPADAPLYDPARWMFTVEEGVLRITSRTVNGPPGALEAGGAGADTVYTVDTEEVPSGEKSLLSGKTQAETEVAQNVNRSRSPDVSYTAYTPTPSEPGEPDEQGYTSRKTAGVNRNTGEGEVYIVGEEEV